MPRVVSWAELNDYLRTCCIRDLNRTLPGAPMTVGAAAGLERSLLKALALLNEALKGTHTKH